MNPERVGFRYTVGLIAVVGGMVGLVALYWVEIPAGNRDAVTLALGIVLGWGSSVVNGEWGSSPAGRQAAEIGVEVQRKALDGPTETRIVNTPNDPANVQQVDDPEARP
jgi:hypothetical protein